MRAIRTRIDRETAGRELSLKFRHECGQGLGRRRGRAPQHPRPRKMSDPIEIEIEPGGSDPIRSPLSATEHVGRERAEEGKCEMKVPRVGCPCADGQERGGPRSQGVADRIIRPKREKPALSQGRRAARRDRRSPPAPSSAARHRDRRRSENVGPRPAPRARPRPDRRSRPASRGYRLRVPPRR